MEGLVRRERAAEYVLIFVVSFAISEIIIRLFLEFAGYPQIAFSIFHFSHVLWGGLLMLIAVMMMLVYSNTWVLRLGSLLSGAGFALFIDEVGKYITKDYNYHYEPALPIIYIVFLLVFLVYIYLHKDKRETPRQMFYDVLDDCKDILDLDLSLSEKNEIEKKLEAISKSDEQPEIRNFAASLLTYLKSINYQKEMKKSWLGQKFFSIREKIKKYRKTHKILFWIMLLLAAVSAAYSIINSAALGIGVLQSRDNMVPALQDVFRSNFPDMVPRRIDFALLLAQWMINFFVGATILAGLFSILARRKGGSAIIKFALVFSLCSSDIIMLYYNQLSQLGPMLLKLAAISYLIFYERLYLKPPIDNPAQKRG